MPFPSNVVLSVKQPWATLLVTPVAPGVRVPLKWCENRSWKPPGKLPSRLMIHASGQVDREAVDLVMSNLVASFGKNYVKGLDKQFSLTSAIIGSVKLVGIIDATQTIVDIHLSNPTGMTIENSRPALHAYQKLAGKNHCQPKFLSFGEQLVDVPDSDEISVYWWMMSEPVRLQTPVKCKGKLRLWEYNVSQ